MSADLRQVATRLLADLLTLSWDEQLAVLALVCAAWVYHSRAALDTGGDRDV